MSGFSQNQLVGRVSNRSVQAFHRVDDNAWFCLETIQSMVAVNFGASATTEVSTGLVRCHLHYSGLAFLADVLGVAEMCSLSTVPGDGTHLGYLD